MKKRVLWKLLKTRSLRRVFQTGVEYRGVFGAISKVLWETCGKLRVSEIAFHKSPTAPSPVAASTGLPGISALKGREAKDAQSFTMDLPTDYA